MKLLLFFFTALVFLNASAQTSSVADTLKNTQSYPLSGSATRFDFADAGAKGDTAHGYDPLLGANF